VRSVNVEGITYPFTEYLLYHPAVGYRWLVESDRHWSYVTPVSPGAVSDLGRIATYENRRYRHFQSAEAKVDRITGEFYWKVELGERVRMSDYVRPPYLLSVEEGGGELQASLATWMKPEELSARIRPPGGEPGSLQLSPPQSVAPNQPFPHRGILMVTAALALLLLVSAAVLGARAPSRSIDLKFDPPLDEPVLAPEDATAPVTTSPDGAVFSRVHFSQPFDVEDGMNLAIHFSDILSNSWDYVAVDLVNEDTGLVQSFDVQLESYSGVEGGESWQEGDSDKTVHLGAVSAGRHALRLELQWPGATRSRPSLAVTMRQGVFRGMYLSLALGLLLIIPILIGLQKFLFEKRRWSESDHPWATGSSDE